MTGLINQITNTKLKYKRTQLSIRTDVKQKIKIEKNSSYGKLNFITRV